MLNFSIDNLTFGVAFCSDCQVYTFPESKTEIRDSSVDCPCCGSVLMVHSKLLSSRSDSRFILEQCIREVLSLRTTIDEQNEKIRDMGMKYDESLKQNMYLEKVVLGPVGSVQVRAGGIGVEKENDLCNDHDFLVIDS